MSSPHSDRIISFILSLDAITQIYLDYGSTAYGGESVSQLEHALQCATFAQDAVAEPTIIAACLLHDIGHLLNDRGCHENIGAIALQELFGDPVTVPIQLHVLAKRYLCTVEPDYESSLSLASRQSLELQGGILSEFEVEQFLQNPWALMAVQVRRWDDMAKIVGQVTPTFASFLPILKACLL